MKATNLSRREFLARVDAAARTSLVVLTVPMIANASARARAACATQAGCRTLGAAEALEFEAIAARILPTDETPGAVEAGAIHFIDAVLGESRTELLGPLRAGLAGLRDRAATRYGRASFSALTEAQQDQLLMEIEDGAFFGTMRYLTIAGTFSLPIYGGNRDGIGWKLIGFENRHAWSPPYGHYDADYAARGE